MATSEFPKSIVSRPVYGKLKPSRAKSHLFVANAEGAEAILELAGQVADDFFSNAHLIYIPGRCEQRFVDDLKALNWQQFYVGPSVSAAMPRLEQTLGNAHMGLQIYTTGTEGLMGQVIAAAMNAGIHHESVQTEHRGSHARRVQCVHCKGITEDVTTDPFDCSHCGLLLFVRDHYSRRMAAFQGVCINAEDPDFKPPKKEVFA